MYVTSLCCLLADIVYNERWISHSSSTMFQDWYMMSIWVQLHVPGLIMLTRKQADQLWFEHNIFLIQCKQNLNREKIYPVKKSPVQHNNNRQDIHTSVCMLTQAVSMYFKTTDYPKFTRPILHQVKHVNVTSDFDEIYT